MSVYFPECPNEFPIALQDATVANYSNCELKVKVTKPDLPAQWFKDGNLIAASDRFTLETVCDEHILKINKVQIQDQGTYCIKVGDTESSASLEVNSKCKLKDSCICDRNQYITSKYICKWCN